MQITWYGHSCFLLQDDAGTRILTDPSEPEIGYNIQNVLCDAVTVSHGHRDHSYVQAAAGNPVIIDSLGAHEICGVPVTGYPSWHDEVQGQKRGANILFLMELDGVRVLHLGDLGHPLSEETIAALGRVDVLLCPVGGVYTIDAAEAKQVAAAIRPQIFIPMHYRTPACTLAIDGIDALLPLVDSERGVHKLNDSTCVIHKDTLGEKRILLLDYVK